MGVQHCILKIDSKVLASQIENECITRDEALERYLAVVRKMERFFKWIHSLAYRKSKEHISRRVGQGCGQEGGATAGSILSNY
jgi:hypothetical protein